MCHSVGCSYAWARRSTRLSAPSGSLICKPIGRPARVNPQGTEIVGSPYPSNSTASSKLQAFGRAALVQVPFSGRLSLAKARISRAKGRICSEHNREFESRPLRHPVLPFLSLGGGPLERSILQRQMRGKRERSGKCPGSRRRKRNADGTGRSARDAGTASAVCNIEVTTGRDAGEKVEELGPSPLRVKGRHGGR